MMRGTTLEGSIGRRFSSLLAVLALSLDAGAVLAVELLYDTGWDNWTTIESVEATIPPTDTEAADDFDISGSIERVIVRGDNDCIGTCFTPPALLGVTIRFYEWTAGGPGALQREEFVAAGDPRFLVDADSPDTIDVTLATPFDATGKHFIAAQLSFDDDFRWAIWVANHANATGSHLWERDNLAGGQWQQHIDILGNPLDDDLAFQLWGCPAGGCTPSPLVAGCGEWNEVDSPNPSGAERAVLNDVDVLAAWDAWAVGVYDGPIEGYSRTRNQSLTMHYDGTAWSLVPSPSPAPSPSTTYVELDAVSAVDTTDVWAVGGKRDQDAGGYTGTRVLAMRWDGFSWSDMNAPWPADGDGSVFTAASGEQLNDVAALGANEVWMTGRWWHEAPSGVISWPGVAMRWNGSGFDVFELPMVSPSSSQTPAAIAAVSPTEIWVVGGGDGLGAPLYTWHWDGSVWTHVNGPTPGDTRQLNAVVALAPDDVWAGGWYREPDLTTHPLLLHWDGSSWTQVAAPAGGDVFAAWAPDDILTRGTGGWAHWDGVSWNPDTGPGIIPSGTVAAMDTVSPCELWGVGSKSLAGDQMTLTVKLGAANNPPGDQDGDGIPDASDNCPADFNPDQADCDADGAGDVCELTSGTAEDCNGNSVPDNCETFDDCNANGVPDSCEIDCNTNGQPDECDIASGTSADCESNGVPDECESFDDCNANAVNDWCDIDGGASADTNANGFPDECEALGPEFATVTTPEDFVDFGGAQQLADLPGPDGLVSLREALAAANNTPGPQTVAFNIPRDRWADAAGASVELRLENGLFQITDDETTLDFTTQTRFTGDSNPDGGEITIYGYEVNAWGVTAILVSADRCVIKGLGRVSQRGYGVTLEGRDNRVISSVVSGPLYAGVYIRGTQGQLPRSGNVIGGTAPGEGNDLRSGNDGVRIDGPAENNVVIGNRLSGSFHGVSLRAGADFNRIGGPAAADRNVISGAGSFGGEGCPSGAQVGIEDSIGNLVENNYIGTTADGLAGNGQRGTMGVMVRNSPQTVLRGNLIADIHVVGVNHCANDVFGTGIVVQGASDQTVVEGNRLGSDLTGAVALPNLFGISVDSWPGGGSPVATRIGGLAAGAGNVVAFSESTGVSVGPSVGGVTISGNSIHDNGGLGIFLSGTGNNSQAAPELTAASTDGVFTMIDGRLGSTPGAEFRIEFFTQAVCDPSGAGEGERMIGQTQVTTDAAGQANFSVSLPLWIPEGDVVTSTATALLTGDTSEFSLCKTVVAGSCRQPPRETARLMVDVGGVHLWWEAFGSGSVYDVSRGQASQLATTPPSCMAQDLLNPEWDDPALPAAGEAFTYLSRARNSCGSGSWGQDTGGGERASACP